jgi:hypothetical protein
MIAVIAFLSENLTIFYIILTKMEMGRAWKSLLNKQREKRSYKGNAE